MDILISYIAVTILLHIYSTLKSRIHEIIIISSIYLIIMSLIQMIEIIKIRLIFITDLER